MKKVMIAAALLAAVSSYAESWVTNEEGKVVAPMALEMNGHTYSNRWGGLTREEIAEKKKAHSAAVYRTTGGKLAVPGSMRGTIRIVNSSSVPNDEIQKIFNGLLMFSKYDVTVSSGEAVSVATATDALKKTKANVAVFVVENDTMSPFIISPEERWAIVNARACGSASRTAKETLRAFAFVAGAASSDYGTTIMSVTKPLELDMVATPELPFDVLNRIQKHLKMLNVTPEVQATYKQACIEGWAPAPTNEVQRVIWEKVKAEQSEQPSNPLKITPGMKPKGK